MQFSMFDLYQAPSQLKQKPRLHAYRSLLKVPGTPDSIKWRDSPTPSKLYRNSGCEDREEPCTQDTTPMPCASTTWDSIDIPKPTTPLPSSFIRHYPRLESYLDSEIESADTPIEETHSYAENKAYWDYYHRHHLELRKANRLNVHRRSCVELRGKQTRLEPISLKQTVSHFSSISGNKPMKRSTKPKRLQPLLQAKTQLNLSLNKC